MKYKRLFIKNSYVFLTVVTYNRKNILVENIERLRQAFTNAKEYFDFVVVAMVVLPDHFHVIINPKDINDYLKIIKAIKYNFSEKIDVVGLTSSH